MQSVGRYIKRRWDTITASLLYSHKHKCRYNLPWKFLSFFMKNRDFFVGLWCRSMHHPYDIDSTSKKKKPEGIMEEPNRLRKKTLFTSETSRVDIKVELCILHWLCIDQKATHPFNITATFPRRSAFSKLFARSMIYDLVFLLKRKKILAPSASQDFVKIIKTSDSSSNLVQYHKKLFRIRIIDN